jgi:hypothetical protein
MSQSNTTRPQDEKRPKENDFDFFLKSGLSPTHVVSLLKAQNKDQKDIDAFMEKYESARKKLKKAVQKFALKIEQKYGTLDQPELVKKGMKFASKYNLTSAEKEAFLRYVIKGNVDVPYDPYPEIGYTEMSKTLGFTNFTGQVISVKPQDYAALNEIARLYELSKPIQAAIRTNVLMYQNCGPEALTGEFDTKVHNANLFVHPLVVAMFLPKISLLEKRMLCSNIGRYVITRSQAYFQTLGDKKGRIPNWQLNMNEVLPQELEADMELASDIVRDPNSMAYFSDESAVANLLKRQNIQIELWKNVLSLRQGKFFSKSESFNADDGVVGLTNVLASYDWTYHDSPELHQVQDEGSMLRKLLSVFSLRPTFIQTQSLVSHSGAGYSNLQVVGKHTFLNTPVCNVRLPANMGDMVASVNLESSLSQQSDWFIENKMLVPKTKQVVHSNGIIFFYVNRRTQSVNFANVDSGIKYLSLPGTLSNLTTIDQSQVEFSDSLRIGNDTFNLKSVVVLNDALQGRISSGCSALVVCEPGECDNIYGNTKLYAVYNPMLINYMVDNGTEYVRKMPIQFMHEREQGENLGFVETSQKFGTIFIYVKPVVE